MNPRDLKSEISVASALNIQSISSDTTTAGTIIDAQGYESLTFVVETGARSAGTVTPLIEWSDDSGLSGSEAVSDDFLIGTEAAAALSAAHSRSTVGVVVLKRYIRLSLVSTGSASLTAGGTVIKSGARHNS